jgi:hypothetical protein
MALTDSLAAVKALLKSIHADGACASSAYLEEKQEAKLKKIHLKNLTPGMLLLAVDEGRKLDKAVCMSPLFATDGVHDQNRACDFVLLRQSLEGLEVFYIEMKSDNPSGCEGQFKSTHCFMHYLVDLANKLCSAQVKITRERYVVFHTDSSNSSIRGRKQKTRFKPQSANKADTPDMYCVRNDETVRCTAIF